MLKRALKIISAAALSVGLAFTLSTPAHAAGASEIPGTALNTNVTFTYEVTDDGGQVFVIKGTWGETYKDSYGDILVTLHSLSINAKGVDFDQQGIDGRVRVYDGYKDLTTVKIQDVSFDGADDPFTLNPRNPLNRPGVSYIRISGVGVDGDGLGGADTLIIKQPVIGDKPPV
jgi:hypothetical protein